MIKVMPISFPIPFKKITTTIFSRIINSTEGLNSIKIINSLKSSIKRNAISISITKKEETEWRLANLHLWAAYTIYDHVLDASVSAAEIPVANLLLIESLRLFTTLAPVKSEIATETLAVMENANQREFLRVQDIKKDPKNWLKLDEKKILQQGHEKSLGLYYGAFLFLEQQKISRKELEKLRTFFRHYLNCRQLADDLYDWREDLENNTPTAVTVSLMKASGAKKNNLSKLEVLVFEKYYPHFHKFLIKNLELAKAAAQDLDFLRKDNFLFLWADKAQKEEMKRWRDYEKLCETL